METPFPANTQTDWVQETLQGPVKTIKAEITRTMDERNYMKAKSNTFRQVTRFSPEGKKLEETNYNPDGSIASKEIFVYDDSGRLKQKQICDSDHAPRMCWSYTYDAEDRTLTELFEGNEKVLSGKEVYQLDEQGRKIEEKAFDTENELMQQGKYFYESQDGNSRIIWEIHNPAGELIKKRVYLYDPQGNLLQKEIYSPTGELESKEVSVYDAQGHILQSDHYLGGSQPAYRYHYEYEFDGRGNWTTRKTHVRFEIDQSQEEFVSEVCRRRIEYFENL